MAAGTEPARYLAGGAANIERCRTGPAAHPGHIRGNGSRDAACTAARAPTSLSRSTRPELSRSSSPAPRLYIPVLLSNVVPWLSLRNWVQHNLLNPTDAWYIVFYGVFIVLFTFFYVHVTFDPYQQADTIRKQGGYIPGFRPGCRPSTTWHGS